MSSGKHTSYEEPEFNFGRLFMVIIIGALIIGVIFGIVTLVGKLKGNKKEDKYHVLGKLIIEQIECEQKIFDSKEADALENGVIKFYGGNLNEEGNFCIAGHNYENIFKRLDELAIGAYFEIVDEDNQSTKYKITEIRTVEPTDLNVLKKQEGKTQITLITCSGYSTERLMIQAEMDKQL